MDNLLQQLLGILVNSPGNLIYHLTLAFSILASLQAAMINRRSGENGGRVLLGLNLILLAQLALFLISGLAWQNIISAHLFLPVFDRAMIVFSLVWIGWLWAFPKPHRIADMVTGFINLGLLILFFFTFTEWNREGASLAFNGTWEDWAWSFSGIAVLIAAIAAALIRRPDGWAIGVGMAALNLGGLIAHLFIISTSGDFGGFIRLAQLAAYPLLPGLFIRQSNPAAETHPANGEESKPSSDTVPSGRSRMADPRILRPWVNLNLQTEPTLVCSGLAHAVAQAMLADLCFVVTTPPDTRSPLILQGGYDLIRDEEMGGTILEQSKAPNLAASLIQARPLRLIAAESRPPDLKTLADALGVKDAGNVLLIPLTHAGKPWGGLILLSPYSNRIWTVEDQNFFAGDIETITAILTRAAGQPDRQREIDAFKEKATAASRESEELRIQNQQLFNDITTLRRTSSQGQANPDIEALIAIQQDTQEALADLQNENNRLKSLIQKNGSATAAADVSQMEKELRSVLQEVARLQNQLAQSNVRIMELQSRPANDALDPLEDREKITAIVHELRQPMSSIMGYTDLLLAESIGILGKAQKKFLEHIRASSDRLRGLIDDLVLITTQKSASVEPAHPAFELADVIDDAVAEIATRLREQRIQLHIDLPEKLPLLVTDRDAVLQVATHLLQNACSVSALNGSIALSAQLHREDTQEFIVLQISDHGGGIAAADLPRVFAKRSDSLPIAGIGENSAGLAIAKSLVDAIGGRIWVDSQAGSSTFTVLLPIQERESGEIGAP